MWTQFLELKYCLYTGEYCFIQQKSWAAHTHLKPRHTEFQRAEIWSCKTLTGQKSSSHSFHISTLEILLLPAIITGRPILHFPSNLLDRGSPRRGTNTLSQRCCYFKKMRTIWFCYYWWGLRSLRWSENIHNQQLGLHPQTWSNYCLKIKTESRSGFF